MGIVRVITLGILVWLAWILYRRFMQHKKNIEMQKRDSIKEKVASVKQCHFCGVHVPINEAVNKGGRYYCCQSHCDQDNV